MIISHYSSTGRRNDNEDHFDIKTPTDDNPYYYIGLLAPSNLMVSLILLPLAFISVLIGYFIQKKIPEKLFFNIIYILLFLSGCKLIFDGIV